MIDEKRRAEIRARVTAPGLTAGPWVHEGGRMVRCKPGGDTVPARTTEDARFLAHARTDVPDLLDAIDEAAPTVEQAREKAIALLRTRKSHMTPGALAPWAEEAVDLIKARVPGAVERFLGIAEGDVLDALCALRIAEKREAAK
jgi:hypothetical protein